MCLCAYVCTHLHGCAGKADMELLMEASSGGPEGSREKPAEAVSGADSAAARARRSAGLQSACRARGCRVGLSASRWRRARCGSQCWAGVAHFTSVSKVPRSTCLAADKTGIRNSERTSETRQPAASWALSTAPEPLPLPLRVSTLRGWTSSQPAPMKET